MNHRYLGSSIFLALFGPFALMGISAVSAPTAINSVDTPSLIQFISNGHALGFTTDSVYPDSDNVKCE